MSSFSSEPAAQVDMTLLGSIERRLAAAHMTEDLQELFSALHWTDVTLTLDARPLMEDLPDLADRFRGAFGRALERRRGDGDDVWSLFFGPQIDVGNGLILRPFAIQAARAGARITFLVRLFGFADCWTDQVLEAMHDAAETGIALRMHGKLRVALPVVSSSTRAHFWRPLASGKRAKIVALTPLVLRHRQSVHGNLEAWHGACIRRITAFAPWCGVTPAMNILASLSASPWKITDYELQPVSWTRYSSNHPGGRIGAGLSGSFMLGDLNEPSLAILQLLESIHAGGGATSGYSQIAVYPLNF
jgi:hypothetical protein